MKTPLIIPAYNEADSIGATLRALDASTVEPFVIVNGDEGARETADIALRQTPNVYVRPEQGKLPAIQFALKKLLEYDENSHTQPILLTDADSWPLLRGEWATTMSRAVAGGTACAAAGVTLIGDGPIIDRSLRNARRIIRAYRDSGTPSLRSAYGSNMAVNFAGNQELIDHVLDLPHIWPGEDRYLLHVVGGENHEHFTQLSSMGSAVLTSARFMKPLTITRRQTKTKRRADSISSYARRRARSATHYFDDEASILLEHVDKPA